MLPEVPYHRKTPDVLLLVDDESTELWLMARVLKNFHVVTEVSSDSEEALRKVEDRHYDWIFVDNRMPNMPGITLIKKMRNLKPKLRYVLCSVFAPPEIVKKAHEAGILMLDKFQLAIFWQLVFDRV